MTVSKKPRYEPRKAAFSYGIRTPLRQMDKSLDLSKPKPFLLDPSVVPVIRRTPADPVEAYFQLSNQMKHLDALSQTAEALLHPETIQLVDQMKQSGVVKTSQLNYLRDSLDVSRDRA